MSGDAEIVDATPPKFAATANTCIRSLLISATLPTYSLVFPLYRRDLHTGEPKAILGTSNSDNLYTIPETELHGSESQRRT